MGNRKRFDLALRSVDSYHRQENYAGPLASTNRGGHNANVNNLYNSQVRDAYVVMPYGISSRAFAGVKAQTVVNDNSENVVVGVYDPSRPSVGVGEVCLYSSGGCSVYLSSTGDISVRTGAGDIDIRQNGVINIYNGTGSINIDAAGNIGMSNGAYSVAVGLYADESSDGGGDGEQVDGITLTAGGTKITLDNATGQILISKDGDAAVLDITADNDIKILSGGAVGAEIMHDENVNIYNSVASAKISNDGKVEIDATNDIKLNTTGKIEFNCTEFKVNSQTMEVP